MKGASLKKKKLKEIAVFVQGLNQTRIKEQTAKNTFYYYDKDAFENDLNYISIDTADSKEAEKNNKSLDEEMLLKEGDIIINSALYTAAIVGKNNAYKIPTVNFTKMQLKTKEIDKDYFIYIFNFYKDVQKQKKRSMQGLGSVLRISNKALEEIEIPIPDFEQQKKIGNIYKETLKLKNQLSQYSSLLEKLSESLLENYFSEGGKNGQV